MAPLYRLVRPLIFRLDPETAHEWSIRALKIKGAFPRAGSTRTQVQFPRLRQRLFGLDFPNPVGLAAGHDKDARAVDAALGLGFGFVEAGTVTPLPQPGNPRPRVFRLVKDKAIINRFGFNSRGHAAAIKELKRRRPQRGIVGINIGANKVSEDRIADYVSGYSAFAPLADYITVNISSPNTPALRELQSQDELRPLLSGLAEARRQFAMPGQKIPPLLLKIAPDLSQTELAAVVEVAIETGIDGLIVANTTTSRPQLQSRHGGEAGGLSGRPLLSLSTATLASAYRLAAGRMPLIGVGGVSSARNAFDKITAGASLVQLYSALIYEGPGLARRIVTELDAIIEAEGYASLGEAVGTRAEKF
ncbi:Dihydroorotate dehydrogenase (quinone) [hydrothermal vent metagenome]|uniref:dihydroorotate dehydrogenase (quinone) n=1 Tax=hydrothermal vent metagenome TaxID=652676 RepID=A0A3B0U055_9ZZZZ